MKPTLRDNYRYLVVRLISQSQLSKEDLDKIVQKELVPIIGQIHYSKVMPKVAFFDRFGQSGIIRCLNGGSGLLRSGLSMMTSYNSEKVHVMPIFTSGTIRKAKEVMNKKTD
mgnify:CR=1 FL=1